MKKGIITKSISVLVVCSFLLGLVGCSKSQGGNSPNNGVSEVKIGSIQPLSGESAASGAKIRQAAEMAVEEINASGGIKSLGGAKIKLVFADSQSKPQVAVSETERLISQENVALLLGAYNSGVTLPASEVAERYKKVWFSPSSSDIAITNRGFKYIFRLSETTPMRVEAQINCIIDMAKQSSTQIKNFALVYENSTFGQGVADSWKKILAQKGVNIVLDEPFDPKAADLSTVVSKVKAANSDIVLLVNSATPAAILLAKGFKEQKVQPKAFVATAGSQTDPDYFKNVGEAALGVFDISAWEPDINRPFSPEVAKKFSDKYGIIMDNVSAKEYVGMYIVKDVLERAASLDSEKIREAFAATNITSGIPQMYANTVRFDQTGTFPDSSMMVLAQFQNVNGKIERVTVFPTDVARKGFKPIFPYTYGK